MGTIPMAPDIKNRNYMVLLYRLDTSRIRNIAGSKYKDVFKDPFEFEDPTSSIYWEKKATGNLYRTEFAEKAKAFKDAITNSIKLDLNGGQQSEKNYIPLGEQKMAEQEKSFIPLYRYDITSLIVSVSSFSNDMDFNNSVSVEVKYEDKFYDSGIFKIRENDIMEVRIKYEGDEFYKTEFLGFITNRIDTSKYGKLNTTSFTAYGIQKLLGLTRIIEQPAVGESRLIEGVEINTEDFTGYSTVFSGLNAGEIFDKIMSNVLSYKGAIYEDISKQFNVRRDRARIEDVITKASGRIEKKVSPNKENILISMGDIYRENEKAIKAKREGESPEVEEIIVAKRQIENDNIQRAREYLNSYIPSGYTKEQIIEKLNKDDKQVVNNVVASRERLAKENRPIGFIFDRERFTNPEDYKTSFLALYGFFKTKELLKTDISLDEKDKYKISNAESDFTVTASIEEGHHKAYNEMTAKSYARFFSQLTTPISILETVRDTTFYDIFSNRLGTIYMRPPKYNEISKDKVISNRDILSVSIVSQDASLKTHVDTKFMFPFIGEIDFVTGSYTDFNILFQYGMRLDNPINNPNVINPTMGGIFSALSLNIQNAKTRTMVVTATNKKYEIGNLYIINMNDAPLGEEAEIVSYVGYLVKVDTVVAYGQVTSHNLTFIYVRKFGYEICKGDMKYDMGRLYDKNILSSSLLELSNNKKKDRDYSDGLLEKLDLTSEFYKEGWKSNEYGIKDGDIIRVFRRLPTILDVQLMIDNDPSLATPSRSDASNPLEKKYLAYSEQDKYFVEEPWNSNPDESYILNTISPYCSSVDPYKKPPTYFTSSSPVLQNYGTLDTLVVEGSTYRYLRIPTDKNFTQFKGLDTPFLTYRLTLSTSGSALLSKRMIKSMFLSDIQMKGEFFMFHSMDGGDYKEAVPTFDSSLIGKIDRGTMDIKKTALRLKGSLIESLVEGSVYSMSFENDYFSVEGTQGLPPGNILGVATDKLSVNVGVSIETKDYYIITPTDSKTIKVYDKNYTALITIKDDGGYKEAAKRIYFTSPYFEMNLERLQQMGWIFRGFSSSGEVPSSGKSTGYNASGNPHLQGRAIDIIIKDKKTKLIPEVLEGTDWGNIQLFNIKEDAIYLMWHTLVNNADKTILYFKGAQELYQDKDGVYFHAETNLPEGAEMLKLSKDKYFGVGDDYPFQRQSQRKATK